MLRIILLTLFFVPCLYAADGQQNKPDLTSELEKYFNLLYRRPGHYLNYETEKNYRDQIMELIKRGDNPNIYGDIYGDSFFELSLLSYFVKRGDKELVLVLLGHKANPNPPRGELPLFLAHSGDMVKCLIDNNADINVTSRDPINTGFWDGLTLLHHARDESSEVFGVFINIGMDPNQIGGAFTYPNENKDGCTPLQWLLSFSMIGPECRFLEKVAMLLMAGASLAEKNSEGQDSLDLIDKNHPSLLTTILNIDSIVKKLKQKDKSDIMLLQEYPEVKRHIYAPRAAILVMRYAFDLPIWKEGYSKDIDWTRPNLKE